MYDEKKIHNSNDLHNKSKFIKKEDWFLYFVVELFLGGGGKKIHTINHEQLFNSAARRLSGVERSFGRLLLARQARHWRSTQSTKTLPLLSWKTRIFVENIRWSCTIINGWRGPQCSRGRWWSWWQWWSNDSRHWMYSRRTDWSTFFLHPTFSLVSIKDDKGSNQNNIHDDDGNDGCHDCALRTAYIILWIFSLCKKKCF